MKIVQKFILADYCFGEVPLEINSIYNISIKNCGLVNRDIKGKLLDIVDEYTLRFDVSKEFQSEIIKVQIHDIDYIEKIYNTIKD